MSKIPVIIDCDPGIDDTFALMMMHASELYDIKALTTVGGNVKLENTTKNAKDVAKFIGLKTRIASGAAKPMLIPLEDASTVHGASGLGNVILEPSDQPLDDKHAWDVIYEEAIKAEGELELVAIGPLTNVAIFLKKYGAAKKYIKRIVIMGGSSTYGNHAPYGEFNIWCDPVAADLVFQSGIPLMMVGLDSIKEGVIELSDWEDIFALGTKGSDFMKLLLSRQLGRIAEAKEAGTYIPRMRPMVCDGMTVACMIDPSMVFTDKYRVDVETTNTMSRGRTLVDWKSSTNKALNCDIALKIDPKKLKEVYIKTAQFYK